MRGCRLGLLKQDIFTTSHGSFFFVLSGTAMLEVNGERHCIEAFQGMEVPPDIPHQMVNESDFEVEFIIISQPKSHGDRIALED